MSKDDLILKIQELINTPKMDEGLSYSERLNKLMEIKVYFDDLEDNPIYNDYISKINNETDEKVRDKLQNTFLHDHLVNDRYLYSLYAVLLKTFFKFKLYLPNYDSNEFKELFKKAGYDDFSIYSIPKVANLDLNLLEAIAVLTIAIRLDYWGDFDDFELIYLIGNNTITKLLNMISDNMNEESIREVEEYLSNFD